MNRNTRTAFTLMSGLFLSLTFSGCGAIPAREYNAVRWIKSDSLFAYLFHSFEVNGVDIGDPEAFTAFPYSRITLYQLAIDPSTGLHGQTLLYHDGNAVPCGELEYRPEDSLLFFSYLVADGRNGIRRHDCGTDSLKRLALGKLVEDRWEPLTDSTVDTAHFLSLLTAGRAVTETGLAIDSAYERLCANGWCIRPLAR